MRNPLRDAKKLAGSRTGNECNYGVCTRINTDRYDVAESCLRACGSMTTIKWVEVGGLNIGTRLQTLRSVVPLRVPLLEPNGSTRRLRDA